MEYVFLGILGYMALGIMFADIAQANKSYTYSEQFAAIWLWPVVTVPELYRSACAAKWAKRNSMIEWGLWESTENGEYWDADIVAGVIDDLEDRRKP